MTGICADYISQMVRGMTLHKLHGLKRAGLTVTMSVGTAPLHFDDKVDGQSSKVRPGTPAEMLNQRR